MDKIDDALIAYAEINEMRHERKFGSKGRVFYCDDGSTLTEDEVRKSLGFASFVDGYFDRPHKYESARGNPGIDPAMKLLTASLSLGIESGLLAADEGVRVILGNIDIFGTYDKQYRNGVLARKNVKRAIL